MLRRFVLPQSRCLTRYHQQQVRHFNSLNDEDTIDGIRFEKLRRIVKFNVDVLVSNDQSKIDAFSSTFNKNDKKRFGIIFDTNENKIGVMCNRLIDVEKKLDSIRHSGEKEFHAGKRDKAIEKMMTEMIKNLDWSDVKFWQYIKHYHSHSLILATVAGLMISYCYMMRSKQDHSFEGQLWKYGGTTVNSAKNNEVSKSTANSATLPKQPIVIVPVEQTTPVNGIIQFREAVAKINIPKEIKLSWKELILNFVKRHYGKIILAAAILFSFWPKFVVFCGAGTRRFTEKNNPINSISSSDYISPHAQYKTSVDSISNIPYGQVVDSILGKKLNPFSMPAASATRRLDLDDIMRS